MLTSALLVSDSQALLATYAVKAVRFLSLWIALYVVEKVYQDRFVRQVLAEEGEPPSLGRMVPTALAIEAVFMLLVWLALWLMFKVFKTSKNTFILDWSWLRMQYRDYIWTTGAILLLGTAIGRVMEDRRVFRYKDDGLRAIRAHALLMLAVSGAILLVPMFMFYTSF